MTVKLDEDERRFFEHLIELHKDSSEPLTEYGILEDDLRVVEMKAENQEQDLDLDKIVDSLVKKDVLEEQTMEKESGGISRDDKDNTLHSTGTEEAKKYVIVNAHVLEEIKDRIE